MFPNAQIIHIIRDGRDCALSMFIRRRDLDVYNAYQAAALWRQYVDSGQHKFRELNADNYYELRYEDMLASTELVMKKVCNFLKEDFSHSIIDFEKSTDEKAKTPLLRKPLQRDNVGKWKRQMTSWQKRVFESVAREPLVRNGYETETGREQLSLPLRAAYRIHNRIATWFNRKIRK